MISKQMLNRGFSMIQQQSIWKNSQLPALSSIAINIAKSDFHTVSFSRNLKLYTNEKLPMKEKLQVLNEHDKSRPIIMLYTWMMAKESHALKYINFYMDRGIDVLKVRISPFDLLRPTKGAHVVAGDVLQFLHSNPAFNQIVIHGFSVGAYLFCETMRKVDEDRKTHGELLKRFIGQIWDSPVDIDGIPRGLPRAVTSNTSIQNSLEKYLKWYMKVNYNIATQHYEKASKMMHSNTVNVPGLFIFSKNDSVSPPEMNARVYTKWESMGYPVFTKCYENSRHVSHFYRYRKDYTGQVEAFLEGLGILEPKGHRAIVGE